MAACQNPSVGGRTLGNDAFIANKIVLCTGFIPDHCNQSYHSTFIIIIPLSHFQRIYCKSHQYTVNVIVIVGPLAIMALFSVSCWPGRGMHVIAKSLESDSRALTTLNILTVSLFASKAPSAGGLDRSAVTARFLTIQRWKSFNLKPVRI